MKTREQKLADIKSELERLGGGLMLLFGPASTMEEIAERIINATEREEDPGPIWPTLGTVRLATRRGVHVERQPGDHRPEEFRIREVLREAMLADPIIITAIELAEASRESMPAHNISVQHAFKLCNEVARMGLVE
jgi:hypothetical protein